MLEAEVTFNLLNQTGKICINLVISPSGVVHAPTSAIFAKKNDRIGTAHDSLCNVKNFHKNFKFRE